MLSRTRARIEEPGVTTAKLPSPRFTKVEESCGNIQATYQLVESNERLEPVSSWHRKPFLVAFRSLFLPEARCHIVYPDMLGLSEFSNI